MSTLTDIKKGIILKFNGEPCLIQEAKFLRMQQRKPVMQTKMKNIKTGQVVEYSFKQGESVELADMSRKKANFLYKEKNKYVFMDADYEQIHLNEDLVGEAAEFLKETQEIDLILYEESIIGIKLPPKVDLKVTQAPPGVKGDTATGGKKPVTLETGAVINVPLFIEEGETIRVNTETREYAERVGTRE
ncbi:MAG TPA: elongation factor P [bacterium]|nr:elongation factor P [bacterium]HPL95705.1 elongation factor P [bacterium]